MTIDQLNAQAEADERMYADMYQAVKVAQFAQAGADAKADAALMVAMYAGRRDANVGPDPENFAITQVK